MAIECDVLVVGAGPAGLTASYVLAKNNLSVVIIEKKTHGGPETTTYDITEGNRINNVLKEIGIEPHKISSKSEWFSQDHNFLLESNIQDYYFKRGPEKDSLENKLLNKLQQYDINYISNSQILSGNLTDKKGMSVKVKIENNDEIIQPKYIIAADGSNSYIRQQLQIKPQIIGQFNGYGAVINTTKNTAIPHAIIYFDSALAPGGYIYLGSVDNTLFACIVTDAIFQIKNKIQQNLLTFIKDKVSDDYSIKNYFSGIGISGIQQTVIENTIFIGGAALFYDPFLGYGLNYTLESAYAIGQAISQDNLEEYKKYTKQIHTEIKNASFTREIWQKADNKFFNNFIQAFNGENDIKDEQITKILQLFDEE